MRREKGKKPVYEELLFHGTQATVVDSISRFNFDWRVSGKHGTAYGDGDYFRIGLINRNRRKLSRWNNC